MVAPPATPSCPQALQQSAALPRHLPMAACPLVVVWPGFLLLLRDCPRALPQARPASEPPATSTPAAQATVVVLLVLRALPVLQPCIPVCPLLVRVCLAPVGSQVSLPPALQCLRASSHHQLGCHRDLVRPRHHQMDSVAVRKAKPQKFPTNRPRRHIQEMGRRR